MSVAGVVNGALKKGKIELVARNDAPEPACEVCGKKATLICPQCVEADEPGWLCERCADDHDCGLGSFLPVVNSPRACVCGYVG